MSCALSLGSYMTFHIKSQRCVRCIFYNFSVCFILSYAAIRTGWSISNESTQICLMNELFLKPGFLENAERLETF